MIELKIFKNLPEAIAFCQKLGDYMNADISKSLNRAAFGLRTDAKRQIVARRGVKGSNVDTKKWGIVKATPQKLMSGTVIKGRRIGFDELKLKVNKTRRKKGVQKGAGITVPISGKQVRFRHAFSDDIYSDTVKVWNRVLPNSKNNRKKARRPMPDYYTNRKGEEKRLKGRFPVANLATVSIPQMADDDDIVEEVASGAHDRFLKQLDHLVDQRVKGFNK